MAELSIHEFQGVANIGSPGTAAFIGAAQVPGTPPIAGQVVAFGAATLSTQLASTTRMVRLFTDTACRVAFGGSGVIAGATDVPLAAGQTEYFGVSPSSYISVITYT